MSGYNGTRHLPKPVKWLVIWGTTLSFVIIGLLSFFGAITPYRPYSLNIYDLDKEAYCPLGEVRSKYASDAKRPPLGSIAMISNHWEWVSKDEKTRIPGQPFEDPFNGDYGVRQGESPRVRFAPEIPGEWRVESRLEVRGFQFLRREMQVIPEVNTQYVSVLPSDAPECLMAER